MDLRQSGSTKLDRNREERTKFSISFSVSRSSKLAISTDINLEHANWSVVMESASLGEREPKKETDKFGSLSLTSFTSLDRQGIYRIYIKSSIWHHVFVFFATFLDPKNSIENM